MSSNIENICIAGVGGIGGYFGGIIAHEISQQKDTTRSVSFIARGAHLEEIRKDGLILNTVKGDRLICKPTLATDDIGHIPSPDLCLLCVKSYDLNDIASRLDKVITNNTIVMPLLNGVDIYERVRQRLKKGIVLPACVYIGTSIEKPGVVRQQGGTGLILCGNDPEVKDFNPEVLQVFFDSMGLNFKWNADPFPDIWEKYVFIAGFGLVTAYSGKTIGGVFANSELKNMARQIMDEIVSISKKRGVTLPEKIVAESLEKANNFPYETKTSYQRDVEAKRARTEGDLFGKTIINMGRQHGIPTPVTQSVYSKIVE